MTAKISRTFEFSRGIVTAIYDPESPSEDCLHLDHSAPLFFSLDEAHRFYAWYMDFLAHARSIPKKPLPTFVADKHAEVARQMLDNAELASDPR